jgi:p-methyltransferase
MHSEARLDCIIVGYHDIGFERVEERAKQAGTYTGAYHALTTESVRFHGKRLPYMDLVNHCVSKARGTPSQLHVTELPSLGVCHLYSFLNNRGLKAEMINSFDHEQSRFQELLSQAPRAVAITTTFYVEFPAILDIVTFIRRHDPATKIIVGGPHIYNLCSGCDNVALEYVLELIGADIYIFDSQGELTLSRVLGALREQSTPALASIPNLLYKTDEGFNKTERVVENNSMDENRVAWESLSPELIAPTVQMRTARSCAFKCAFCSYPTLAGPLSLTSLDFVETQLRYFREIGVQNLVFVDDTFNVPLPRFKSLCRILAEYGFQWFSYFRCSNADREAFDLMQKSGCAGVFLGIESGDQMVLNNMNKFADVGKYLEGIDSLTARGIMTFTSLIVGFPGETADTIQRTIEFIERARPTFYRAELYWHETLVKVPVHERADAFQLTGGGYNWRHSSMDWNEACGWIDYMYRAIGNSIVLPGYMFNFWALPYLIGKGFSLDKLKAFTARAQRMLIQGLGAGKGEMLQEEEELTGLFRA